MTPPKHVTGKLGVRDGFICSESGEVLVRMVNGCQEANAAELVRRWNEHDELVNALKALLGDVPAYGDPGHIDFSQALQQAKALLERLK